MTQQIEVLDALPGSGEDLCDSEVHIRAQRIRLYNVQICVIIVF